MVNNIPFRLNDDRPVGPIVNVAFTIDGECVDLLHRAGKNRSRTVRNAIKSYLRGDWNRQEMIETHETLMGNYQRVLNERDELKKIINSCKCLQQETAIPSQNQTLLVPGDRQPGKKQLLILERLRNLFNKHRE